MKTLRERFFAKVRRDGECLEWTGRTEIKDRGCRPTMTVNGKDRTATHVAWFLCHGEWPEHALVRTCKNPLCVDVKHLMEVEHLGKKRPMREKFIEKTRWEGDCLVWTGCISDAGYGNMGNGRGGRESAHRIAWFLEYGYWPRFLMHSCDNPACVNVRHLSEGSHTLNQQDKVSKGRQAKGRKVGAAKLCELTVREIKFRYPNEPTEALAEEYGISRAHISRIATGGVWRHTGEPSLTERKMKRYEVSGEMLHVQEIARRYGLPETTVRGRIASGYTGEDLIRAKSSHTRRYR